MPVLIILAIAAIIWAVYTNRVKMEQLPSLLLVCVGGFLAMRGQFIFGVVALAAGAFWFTGSKRRINQQQSHAYHLSRARDLLGASVHDTSDTIRKRHRQKMLDNHPDTGGNEEKAQELNSARDLLLREIK